MVDETLRVTNLGGLDVGDAVNFERCGEEKEKWRATPLPALLSLFFFFRPAHPNPASPSPLPRSAARVGDEIGGHLVSGHVACLATLTGVIPSPAGDGNLTLRLAAPGRWGRYLLPKGFVALDGVSLTLGADVCQPGSGSGSGRASGSASSSAPAEAATTTFAVHLIPETLRATTLGRLTAPGAVLNLEVDAATQAVVDAVEAAVEARLEAALAARGL